MTGAVRVSISFVNGDGTDWLESVELLDRLADLQARGLRGKRLINELFTDD